MQYSQSLVLALALLSNASGFAPAPAARALRATCVARSAVDEGCLDTALAKLLRDDGGEKPASAADAPAVAAPAGLPALNLAWDDNAAWLEQCKAAGVISWYDVGLRLTAAFEGARKACFSGDAYGRTPMWAGAGAAPAAVTTTGTLSRPKRAAWSGGVYEAEGRTTAPPSAEQRASAARMEAVAGFLATKPEIPRAGGLGPPSRRAYSGSSYPSGRAAVAPAAVEPMAVEPATAGGALAWNDKTAWLEQCEVSGVVSWFDAGLRLTDAHAATGLVNNAMVAEGQQAEFVEAAAAVDNLEANLIPSAEDLADSLSRDYVDVLARLASRTNHLEMEDIEMCRALPIDESHLLIETMTCTGEDQLCLMHATPVDIPDECVLIGGISADCVVDALESLTLSRA